MTNDEKVIDSEKSGTCGWQYLALSTDLAFSDSLQTKTINIQMFLNDSINTDVGAKVSIILQYVHSN